MNHGLSSIHWCVSGSSTQLSSATHNHHQHTRGSLKGVVMMAKFCSIPHAVSRSHQIVQRSMIRALRDSYEPALKEKMVCNLYLRGRGHNCQSQSMVNVVANTFDHAVLLLTKGKGKKSPLASDWGTSSSKLRSRTRVFNIKEDCLYCAKTVIDYNVETKIPRNRRVRAHDAMTKATLQSVMRKLAIAMMSGEMLLDFAYPMS
ncbi:hypothetical protein GWK47_019341 [Chionoecetes opilio]|uniref:Uncharacterized protein n=1 Tax=Chionoecetes opilio TaxID=41210 RepID=A0A8J4XSF5_CHIOP|nr:hypothetical protein GWK47_019341 [Chionoecetes opilio]